MEKEFCKHGHNDWVIYSNGQRVCRICRNNKAREYKDRNRDKINNTARLARKKDPERYRAYDKKRGQDVKRQEWARFNQIERRYNLTKDQFYKLLAQQNNACGICETSFNLTEYKKNTFNIDHNHVTGEVRGILCLNCNDGIGKFKDDLNRIRSAINYLESCDNAL